MTINENTAKLISELEDLVGHTCYNGDSYNGWTDEYGCSFRYPVTYLKKDGTRGKAKYSKLDMDYSKVDEMFYKFGANELYIGAGLIHVLNELEKRFGLDFDELVKKKR